MDRAPSPKILTIDRLATEREAARARGERVVHCHGCFDIVHPGHVRHLQFARGLGDRLIVSITPDEHVGKGAGRPMFSADLRAENLAALGLVDWVCVNDAPTATPLLERLRPDVYVKGREYESNHDPRFAAEKAAVERHSGRVVYSSGDVVFSSTAIVGALRRGESGDPFAPIDPVARALARLRLEHDLGFEAMSARLDAARGLRALVIGEAMIDRYVSCAWPRVAGEAPMLALRPIDQTAYDGGSAAIALHAAALGASVDLIAPLPDDPEAAALSERLAAAGVRVHPVRVAGTMAVKERLLVGREKLVKIDRVQPIALDSRARAAWLGIASDLAAGADAAIVADYGSGALGPAMIGDLFATLRPRARVLCGDVSGGLPSLHAMADADWLSPTEAEIREAAGHSDRSLPAVAWDLARRTRARFVTVTMGAEGLVAFRRAELTHDHDGAPSMLAGVHIPSLADRIVDPLGCGDALLAAASLSLAVRPNDPVAAAYLGSAAAAVAAEAIGNAPINARALRDVLRRRDDAPPIVHTLPRHADRPARLIG